MTILNAELTTITQKVQLLLKLNRYETAERLLNSALDDFGDHAALHNLLGLTYQKQSQFTKAITYFKNAQDCDPDFVEAGLNHMVTLCDLGRYNDAQELNHKLAKQASALKKSRPELELKKLAIFHYEQGQRYQLCGLMPEATQEYRKALSLDSSLYDARLELAKVLFQAEQLRKACEELENLVKDAPEFIPGRIWLGIVYYKLGNLEDAQTQWARANAADPHSSDAKAYLNIASNLTNPDITAQVSN